jgi:hypothetical protein
MIEDFDNLPELPTIMGPAHQVAYVVNDIDAAMRWWHSEHGVGPFLIARSAVPLNNAYYRGQKARTTRAHIAFAYVGDMQLELIELVGDTPGLYKEALDRGHTGVHHYAVLVEDFPKAYNWALDTGFDAVIDAGVDGLARMSYMENPQSGLILEVIEWNALTRPYFDTIRQMLAFADPERLVHEFDLRDITPKMAVFGQLLKFSVKRLFGRVKPTRRAGAAAA